MKKFLITLIVLVTLGANAHSQDRERFGKALNLGFGVGYYGYMGRTVPVVMLNYELDVARNFTLAPFIGYYSHRNHYYWGQPDKPKWDETYRYYNYRETVIPVGVKGTYYFDQLLHANANWDFYAAGSIGFAFRSVTWDNDYYGDKYIYHNSSGLIADIHIGTEYHFNQKIGLFLDLSSGISTLGLGIHF